MEFDISNIVTLEHARIVTEEDKRQKDHFQSDCIYFLYREAHTLGRKAYQETSETEKSPISEFSQSFFQFLLTVGGTEGLRRLYNFRSAQVTKALAGAKAEDFHNGTNPTAISELAATLNLTGCDDFCARVYTSYMLVLHHYNQLLLCPKDDLQPTQALQALYRIAMVRLYRSVILVSQIVVEDKRAVENTIIDPKTEERRVQAVGQLVHEVLKSHRNESEQPLNWDQVWENCLFWELLQKYWGPAVLVMSEECSPSSIYVRQMWQHVIPQLIHYDGNPLGVLDFIVKSLETYIHEILRTGRTSDIGAILDFQDKFLQTDAPLLLWDDWNIFLRDGICNKTGGNSQEAKITAATTKLAFTSPRSSHVANSVEESPRA